jgi:hypothetical protein
MAAVNRYCYSNKIGQTQTFVPLIIGLEVGQQWDIDYFSMRAKILECMGQLHDMVSFFQRNHSHENDTALWLKELALFLSSTKAQGESFSRWGVSQTDVDAWLGGRPRFEDTTDSVVVDDWTSDWVSSSTCHKTQVVVDRGAGTLNAASSLCGPHVVKDSSMTVTVDQTTLDSFTVVVDATSGSPSTTDSASRSTEYSHVTNETADNARLMRTLDGSSSLTGVRHVICMTEDAPVDRATDCDSETLLTVDTLLIDLVDWTVGTALSAINTGCAILPDLLRSNADIIPKSGNVAQDKVKGFLNVGLAEATGSTETKKKQKSIFCLGQSRLLDNNDFGFSMIKCHVPSLKVGQTVSQALCSAYIEAKTNVTGLQGGCDISQISCSSSSRSEIHEGTIGLRKGKHNFSQNFCFPSLITKCDLLSHLKFCSRPMHVVSCSGKYKYDKRGHDLCRFAESTYCIGSRVVLVYKYAFTTQALPSELVVHASRKYRALRYDRVVFDRGK